MNTIIRILTKTYFYILHLYPSAYRTAFQDEMLLDFEDLLADASQKGFPSLIAFCLREVRDIPLSLAFTHLEENRMLRVFRFQPVNLGLRSALALGVAFVLSNIFVWFVFLKLSWLYDPVVQRLQNYYIDFNQGVELTSWMLSAICSLLTGFVMGVLFAFLFGDRASYSRYILVGTLGWFLQSSVSLIFSLSYNIHLQSFLGTNEGASEFARLGIISSILSGAVFGLVFLVAKSERPGPVLLMSAIAVAYPLIAYIYLFNFQLFYTSWRFLSLAILLVIFVGGVFFIAVKSATERKLLWIIVAGAIGKLIVSYLFFFVGQLIFGPSYNRGYSDTGMMERIAETIWYVAGHGILFGLLLGIIFGLLKKNALTQTLASS